MSIFFLKILVIWFSFSKANKLLKRFGIKDNVYQKSDFFSDMTFTNVFFLSVTCEKKLHLRGEVQGDTKDCPRCLGYLPVSGLEIGKCLREVWEERATCRDRNLPCHTDLLG